MGWLADRTVNPSVIYATYAPQGRIITLDNNTIDSLKSQLNICRIIVGHQPLGDAPLFINCAQDFHVSNSTLLFFLCQRE
jgi:hypothetical protein